MACGSTTVVFWLVGESKRKRKRKRKKESNCLFNPDNAVNEITVVWMLYDFCKGMFCKLMRLWCHYIYIYTVSHKKEATYFCLCLCKNTTDFGVAFTVRYKKYIALSASVPSGLNKWYMWYNHSPTSPNLCCCTNPRKLKYWKYNNYYSSILSKNVR